MTRDLDSIRKGLAVSRGKQYWRGLEELAETEEFREMMRREFPDQAAEWTDPVTRRQFLLLMGASLGLAGLSGCSTQPAPRERIMPYVRQPEEIIPGKPLFFATATTLGGIASGVLVESHEGRPTKVEGNPDHPGSLRPAPKGRPAGEEGYPSHAAGFRPHTGPTDLFAQASILDLYDPDRSQVVTYQGQPSAWNEALGAIRKKLQEEQQRKGAGLRVLTETITSPTLVEQLKTLLQVFPEARWHRHEPAGRSWGQEGVGKGLFDADFNSHYNFKEANVILALDADFLECGPGHLRYLGEFTARRREWRNYVSAGEEEKRQMQRSRLYAVECMPSLTGAKADHRLPLRASQIEAVARHVAAALAVPLEGAPEAGPLPEGARRWVDVVVRDLQAQPAGSTLVIAGDSQPAAVHALALAINEKLGNPGKTVYYTRPVETPPDVQPGSLGDLVQDMQRPKEDPKHVEMLVILDSNPVFTAPADFGFGELLQRENGPLLVHMGLYQNETAAQCHWHLPEAHYLEMWGDARAFDGTVSLIQPLIAPLYGEQIKSSHELFSAMLAPFTKQPEQAGYEVIRAYWRDHPPTAEWGSNYERAWRKSLHDGLVRGTEFPRETKSFLKAGWASKLSAPAKALGDKELEIVFAADPTVYDGRFANNGWLQELPKPLTKLTWDNAVFLSPKTAGDYGLKEKVGVTGGEHGRVFVDMVKLEYGGRDMVAPVWILPGHPDGAATVHFGYGRTQAGRVGNDTGFNFYQLRTSAAPWFDTGLKITLTGETYTLACTQVHHSMEGREPVKSQESLEEYQKDPDFAREFSAHEQAAGSEKEVDRRLVPLTLYEQNRKEHPYNGYKWGLAVDLTACTGCSACVVACQAENNIPVVGKHEVTRGREMHWIRIDRYYEKGSSDPNAYSVEDEAALRNPTTYFQPVPCMHCENAPCELVCPVGATVHSDDGLNDMVYNRCVGTRYCSNNCPYKVRRFNFLQYSDYATQSLKLGHNPEVTVRTRGIMEKCTYCVQRIRSAEIEAKRLDRSDDNRPGVAPIYDGEVMTACQAACPADAIIFGDLNDPHSEVFRWKESRLNYALLAELNTQPRTTYLAALRNRNPEIP